MPQLLRKEAVRVPAPSALEGNLVVSRRLTVLAKRLLKKTTMNTNLLMRTIVMKALLMAL
jgi:hypothetical protein